VGFKNGFRQLTYSCLKHLKPTSSFKDHEILYESVMGFMRDADCE